MSRLSQASLKLLQAVIVVGALAGCTTEPENQPAMMGDGKMNMGDMKCDPEMMKGMSPDRMTNCMKNCMGSNAGMMGNPQPQPADDSSHAQHHPAGSN